MPADPHPDYLTDARLMKIPFLEIKRYITVACDDEPEKLESVKKHLFYASTKFALVQVAEAHGVALAELLDSVGDYDAAIAMIPQDQVPPPKTWTPKKGKPAAAAAPAAEAAAGPAAA